MGVPGLLMRHNNTGAAACLTMRYSSRSRQAKIDHTEVEGGELAEVKMMYVVRYGGSLNFDRCTKPAESVLLATTD